MVKPLFRQLVTVIFLASFLTNQLWAQNSLVPIEAGEFRPSGFSFEPPTKTEKWAAQGEAFAVGTVGFMMGATALQFIRAYQTGDPMLRAAAIDALADLGGWADLMVFSAASQVSTMALQALVANKSHTLFNTVTKQMMFGAFLHGSGMTVGSIAMHFYSKYRTSKERADRQAQDREWGYWVEKRDEIRSQIAPLNIAVMAQTLKGKELEERKAKISELRQKLEEAQKRVEHHRAIWRTHAVDSFRKIVDTDAKEAQQLVVSTTQMLITTAIVPFIKGGITMAAQGAKWLAFEGAVSQVDHTKFARSFTAHELDFVKNKFALEFAKPGFDKDKFLKTVSKDVMELRLKQNVKTAVGLNLPQIKNLTESLKGTDLEKTWAKGRAGSPLFTREAWQKEIVSKISLDRKALVYSKKVGKGLLASAVSAVIWLSVNEQLTIPYYTKFGYEYSLKELSVPVILPVGGIVLPKSFWPKIDLSPIGKYLNIYKLEDRIADSKKEVVEKALKAIRNHKELKKEKISYELDALTAMNATASSAPNSDEQKIDMPESYVGFLQAIQNFDDVFKTHRSEIVLRELNEHYVLYVNKVDKLINENNHDVRFLKWFSRGAKLDDKDFLFNGSSDSKIIEQYKTEIEEDTSSPLYGAQVGNPWHKDPKEFAGAFEDEYREFVQKYKVTSKTTPQKLLATADILEKQLQLTLERETNQFGSFATEILNKIMPEGREYANAKVSAGPLERSYEQEFEELKNMTLEIAKQSPPAPIMGALINACREVKKSQDPFGTSFFNPEYKKASDELNKLAQGFDDSIIQNYEKLSLLQRADVVALQLHLAMDNIKSTYNKLQKQKQAILKLDMTALKKAKDFNTENLLENPYNKKAGSQQSDDTLDIID